MAQVRTDVKAHEGLFAAAAAPSGYGPADLQSAYNLPSAANGADQTVAVVDAYDDPNAEQDLQTYRQQYGLPACTTANGCFEKVNQRGQQGSYPSTDAGWAEEESLDMDMVSAVCPNCHILLVESDTATNSDMYAAEDEAVALGAKYVSNSWGEAEYTGEQQDDQYFNHPGVAITAAGGDAGYLGRGTANWPASSQYVTSIGGTTLTRDASTARGWAEKAWGSASGGEGTGSGCSQSEPKQAWQQDPGCANRMTTDVSAVGDPATGVAVYDTFGGDGGWEVFGGTSVSTPIIASTYALAGAPAAGSYPSSYPYLHSAGLNDVVSGANGTCDPAYFCAAGPGYDGPTGLGTPDGAAAFAPVNAGTVAGTVTDAATGRPLAGAAVTIGDAFSTTTGSNGDYTITVAIGNYTVTARAFGYAEKTVTGVTVAKDQTTTENFALATVPRVTLSGTVTDGSGHGWPERAKITVAGTPLGGYSSPFTGTYSMSVPDQTTYTLHVDPLAPGYAARDVTVQVGTSDLQQDIKLAASPFPGCTMAPGYTADGLYESFNTWSGVSPGDGWTVTDNNNSGHGWAFDNTGGYGNLTGGSGNFAIADSFDYGVSEDTSLVSPAADLSGNTAPEVMFDTAYLAQASATVDVDLSLDGGQSWQNIWHRSGTFFGGQGPVDIAIPQAAGRSSVQVRFHLTGGVTIWQVDDVLVGSPACTPIQGGLVAGVATDANTSQPVNGATVARSGKSAESAITEATGDPALPGGFYELFSPQTGSQDLTAAKGGYETASASVDVTANTVARKDFALKAGRLAVSPGSLSAALTLGGSVTKTVAFRNDGTAPLHVVLGPQGDDSAPGGSATRQGAGAVGSTWNSIPARPDGAGYSVTASYGGKVYSVGGAVYPGQSPTPTASGYVYDPTAGKWSPIPPLPQAVENAAGGFIGGQLYVTGGMIPTNTTPWYASNVVPVAATYAFNPLTNVWTRVADLPQPLARAGAAVLGGQLYVVGGCPLGQGDDSFYCPNRLATAHIQAVYRYDPASGAWTRLADYPVPVSQEACAGIQGEVVCAGGIRDNNDDGTRLGPAGQRTRVSTYIYHPVANTWTRGADMPYGDAKMAYSAQGGKLVVAAGTTGSSDSFSLTPRAAAYDPAGDSWSLLPDVPRAAATKYGSGACGFYLTGPNAAAVLPGLGDCSPGVPWLSASTKALDLAPGQSATVTVTVDSAKVPQPGSYRAGLWISTDSPYLSTPVAVAMTVAPPSRWGRVAGTVTDARTGTPVAWDGTVLVCAYDQQTGGCGGAEHPLTTGRDGSYGWWLDSASGPVLVVAAKDRYQPQAQVVLVHPGATTTVNFALKEDPSNAS